MAERNDKIKYINSKRKMSGNFTPPAVKNRVENSKLEQVKAHDDLVSIIVPVYNVEQLLPRCLDSLLAQDYQNLEIILINDGSPDNSRSIIADYESKHPELIVAVDQENQGAGAARNNGLKIARGKWVCFVDSDDYVEKDYVSTMLYMAYEQNADIVVSNLYLEKPNGFKVIFPLLFTKPVLDGDKAARKSLDLMSVPNFAWNKLYKRELLEEINFAFPSIYFEDVAIAAQTLYNAPNVAFTNKALYHYCLRKSSQVGSFNEKKLWEALDAIEMVGDFLSASGEMQRWTETWKQLLSRCKFQFTVQIMLQMKDMDMSARYALIKDMNARFKEIDRKYRCQDSQAESSLTQESGHSEE